MRILLAFLFVLWAFTAMAEDFKDYRHYPEESPESFEYRLNENDMLPGSAVIFKEGHILLWDAADVGAATLKNGKIAAVEQSGTIFTMGDKCGGLVAPDNTDLLSVGGDFLSASAKDKNHFYYLPACSEIGSSTRRGHFVAISDRLVCEAGAHSRYVSDLFSGALLYEDEISHTIQAIYATFDSCYFLDSSGNVDKYSYPAGLSAATNVGDNVSSASAYEGGFIGFSEDLYFKMNISSVGTLIEYESAQADCFLAADSAGTLCKADYEALAPELSRAKKLMLGEEIYILSDEGLRAYSRETGWIKELLLNYPSPVVYEKDGDMYMTGVLGEAFKLTGEGEASLIEKIPDGATKSGSYKKAVVYDADGRYLWRYAELVKADIYRHEHNGVLVYFDERIREQ